MPSGPKSEAQNSRWGSWSNRGGMETLSENERLAPIGRLLRPLWKVLGIVAALIWLVVGLTGIILAYHFEMNDRLVSAYAPDRNLAGIERRIDAIEASGNAAKVNWIWTTAGMQDRFFLNYTATDGASRNARIAGDGTVLLDMPEGQRTALEWVREVHLSLVAGEAGEWILAISGLALIGYILRGLARFGLRRKREERQARPENGRELRRRYRTIGLVGAIPALVVVLAAVVIHFEHDIEGPIGAPPIALAPVAPAGTGIGFAAAVKAAEAAIPGSSFAGTPMPTAEDATYKIWVNQPGEYFRKGGYGGSLVLVNANDGIVRGAWPLQQASAPYKFMALPYPVHTGEIAGPLGRLLVMLVGVWLVTMLILHWVIQRQERRKSA